MNPADIRTGEEDEEQLLGNMRVKLFKHLLQMMQKTVLLHL
jgi:hypothetical protein